MSFPWPLVLLLVGAIWLIACGVCLAIADALGKIDRAERLDDRDEILYLRTVRR